MQTDHLVLLANLVLEIMSKSQTLTEYSHILATFTISFLGTGLINLLADQKLKEAADSVNMKPVERFFFSKRSRYFMVSNWASIKCGDIIKIKTN